MRRVHMQLLSLVLSAAAALPASAQHVHPAAPGALNEPDARATTALTAEQVRQLLAGEGMGLAKPAELLRYPGPRHLLDRAMELALTAEQQRAVAEIRERMLAAARGLGAEIVEAERQLDAAFAARTITTPELAQRASAIAALQGRLRSVHLGAHLETLPLLTPAQVERYYAGR